MGWIDAVMQGMARRRNALLWSGAFAGFTVSYGCSTSWVPTDLVADAELGVRAAHDAGAEEHAPISFRSAKEKLAQSKRAMEDKRYEEARRLAESAQVDAEVAEARAEARIMRRAADRLKGRDDSTSSAAGRDSRQPLNGKSAKE